jgi:hypothetical protein
MNFSDSLSRMCLFGCLDLRARYMAIAARFRIVPERWPRFAGLISVHGRSLGAWVRERAGRGKSGERVIFDHRDVTRITNKNELND